MKQNRSNLFLGILLIAVGGWLIATRQVPDLRAWLDNNFTWPMWTIGAGVLVLLIGLITGAPGMAVPASIIAGIGGILYYQNQTGNFASWSYAWTLIPGFVGVGTMLAGLLGENTRRNLGRGLRLVGISAVLFLVFATFLGNFNLLGEFGPAILLILLGVFILARSFWRSGGQNAQG